MEKVYVVRQGGSFLQFNGTASRLKASPFVRINKATHFETREKANARAIAAGCKPENFSVWVHRDRKNERRKVRRMPNGGLRLGDRRKIPQ